MSKEIGKVKFYATDKHGVNRIMSFKVTNRSDALKALQRFNQKKGWFYPDQHKTNCEFISVGVDQATVIGRCQFYAVDQLGKRRIFSFKVKSKADAIDCLIRMNQPSGFYLPNELVHSSERIYNTNFNKVDTRSFLDRLDDFLKI